MFTASAMSAHVEPTRKGLSWNGKKKWAVSGGRVAWRVKKMLGESFRRIWNGGAFNNSNIGGPHPQKILLLTILDSLFLQFLIASPPSLPSILLGSISQQLFPATLKKKKKKYIYLLKIKKRKKEERKKKRGGVPFTILSFFVPLLQSWNNTHPLKTCLNCNAAIGFSF